MNSWLTPWITVLLQKLIITQLVKKFSSPFMELEGSLSCTQGPATSPCPEPDEPSPHPPIHPLYFPNIHSDIIFSSTPRSSKWSHPFMFSNQSSFLKNVHLNWRKSKFRSSWVWICVRWRIFHENWNLFIISVGFWRWWVALWLVIDPCVNFGRVYCDFFGIFYSSIFWDTRRWIKSKSTIRSIPTHHRQNPTEINTKLLKNKTNLSYYQYVNNSVRGRQFSPRQGKHCMCACMLYTWNCGCEWEARTLRMTAERL
jgi:hypothetical protein